MNLAPIHAWLASARDFADGAALYAQVGDSAVFKRLFALGPSDFAREALARELAALVAADAETLLPPAPARSPPSEPGPVRGLRAALLPEASPLLLDLQQQLRQVRDERSHLHPQLTARGTGQARRLALAARIVGLTHREAELKALVGHVQQHGRLPGPVPLPDVTDAGELRQRLTNLRALRSKLKLKPDRAADLARVQADIDLITNKLKS